MRPSSSKESNAKKTSAKSNLSPFDKSKARSLTPPSYGIAAADNPQPLQAKFGNSFGRSGTLKRKGETGLPTQLKARMEQMGGVNLSDVKVNYNSSKPKQIGALAYTRGNQIEIGPGQERHLAHEAWHAVQQKQGRVTPTTTLGKGLPVNNDAALEKEADVMGARALQGNLPNQENDDDRKKMIKRRKQKRRGLRDARRLAIKNNNNAAAINLEKEIDRITEEIKFIRRNKGIKSESHFFRFYHNRVGNDSSFKNADKKGILKGKGSQITGRKVYYKSEQVHVKEREEKLPAVRASDVGAQGMYTSTPIKIPTGAKTMRLRVDAKTIKDTFELHPPDLYFKYLLEPFIGKYNGTPFYSTLLISGTQDTGFIKIPEHIRKIGYFVIRIDTNNPQNTEWVYQFEFGGIQERIKEKHGIKIIKVIDTSQQSERRKKRKRRRKKK